jgi:hypothetical protein
MSMPHEPLTPEERALAQSLSRLGPHGGPSADLDARILGAARAAVQSTPSQNVAVPPVRRRWPLGMGVAASLLLAAGIAWQLRPMHEVPVASEAPMDAARSVGGVAESPEVAAADAASVPAADVPAPPGIVAEVEFPPAPAKVVTPPPVGQSTAAAGPARQNAEAAARQEPAPKRSPLAIIPPSPPSPPAPVAVPQAFPVEADGFSSPATAANAAEASETFAREQEQAQRVAAQQEKEQRVFYSEQRREAAAKAEDNVTLDSIMVTGSRVTTRDRQAKTREGAAPAAAPPPPPPPAASAGSVQPSAARNALRRTDLQVPVDADTRLPPEEWLDRIRLRRDLGDNANALRSLQLFVQEHPFQRVPDDLRPLLGTP